ncbi:protein-L-isoaspartate(D-aspartate) O-methyltransferase [Streptomyces sp. TRM70308]|uniref:protein-L-isoaspartate O-methyltransferase family protein n=1 Tax=Streptomyces sp. TRM70308 TaxID=3131932 RepID=UPI003D011E06
MPVTEAFRAVPERHYTHHQGRGETEHRSNPAVVRRELTTLDVVEGMHVLEIGTGSGYSGALLATLVGARGTVTSVDIDPYLTRWANLIHADRGLTNIWCHTADGATGYPEHGPYQRAVAWCTPALLPRPWVEQMDDGGLIVTALPIAAVPRVTVVAKIAVTEGRPHVHEIAHGGYIEATASSHTGDVPARWVDWERRVPDPAWVSLAWRAGDDRRHTGARAVLDALQHPAHTDTYDGEPLDWDSWRTWAAATADPHLTLAGPRPNVLALGHSTATTAAAIQTDGTLLADAPDSPSLAALRGWLADWEAAGRPAPATYHPHLVQRADGTGWDLRVTR